MSPQEEGRLAKAVSELSATQAKLTEEVHIHIALTEEKFEAFRVLCGIRHGLHPDSINRLEGQFEQAKGSAATLKAIIPWLISAASIAITIAITIILNT